MFRLVSRGAVLLLIAALLVPVSSRAGQTQADDSFIQVGPVIVLPSLALKETYNDNVYATAENTESDFITSIMPELKLIFPFRLHELSLGASAEFRRYMDNSSLDITPYEVFGLGNFSIGDRIKLKVGDTYQRNEEPPLDSPNGTSDVYIANAAAISLTYAFVEVSQMRLDYTRTSLDYLDSAYRSRAEDLAAAYLVYRVLPNTSAFLEYDFKNVTYRDSGDLNSAVHSGFLGATWEITEYSKGTAKAGYLSKDYEDASLEDFSTWVATIDLQHRLTDAASVRLLAKRDVNEGKESDIRLYTTTGLFADFTYRFLDRLSAVLVGSYALDDFSDPGIGKSVVREDRTAHVGLEAKYSFSTWLDLALGYSHTNRDSNIAQSDAIINAVALKVTAYR